MAKYQKKTKGPDAPEPLKPKPKQGRHHFRISEKWLGLALLLAALSAGLYYRLYPLKFRSEKPELFTFKGEKIMGEFDSYYYLRLMRSLGEKGYYKTDSLRYFPQGVQRQKFPPLLPLLGYAIQKVTGWPRYQVALYLPVILSLLLFPAFFYVFKSFHWDIWQMALGLFFTSLSLTYLVRSSLGIFDTDSLNVVFVYLIPYGFYRWSKDRKRKFLLFSLAMAFLFIWWWNTARSVVILIILASFLISYNLFYSFHTLKRKIIVSIILLLAVAVVSFKELLYFVQLVLGIKEKYFSLSGQIAEMDPLNYKEFYSLSTGLQGLLWMGVVGFLLFLFRKKLLVACYSVPFVFGLLPFWAGSRFLIFSAPMLAIGLAHWLEEVRRFRWTQKLGHALPAVYSAVLIVPYLKYNVPRLDKDIRNSQILFFINTLKAVDSHIPDSALVYASWDFGYLLQYYKNAFTYVDGEIAQKEEELFYVYHPLASYDIRYARNFICFYSFRPGGIDKIKESTGSLKNAFNFLHKVFTCPDDSVEGCLQDALNRHMLNEKSFSSVKEWREFLFPQPRKPIYLLLSQWNLVSVFWFNYGHVDWETFKPKGLPLYLQLYNLQRAGNILINPQIRIDLGTGFCLFMGNAPKQIAKIVRIKGDALQEIKYFSRSLENSFVFYWKEDLNYGVIMSYEMSRTLVPRLFLYREKNPYFQPVLLQDPFVQVWRLE
ncbi:MAG: hypothetical protein N2110_04190 [Flavobacteriales bacterium]|nr:hypothetical protein [Flavobacteriales bacterium]MCX7768209.1 hypothetical protein [Flavobacteriales bacterium]MDW8409160.1 STT3 domain-containing protein [Flavobacteriales bacterium]